MNRQFNSILRSIKRTAEFVDSEEFGRLTYTAALTRQERLESIWEKLNELHQQWIGQMTDGDVEECQNQLEQAEDLYYIASTALREKIAELTPQLANLNPDSEAGASGIATPQERPINVSVNLPEKHHDIKNTWGKFDGSLTKWQSFRDCFVARIHNEDNIPNVYKFTYLKNSLTGAALKTMGEWHLTQDSYMEAWDRLNQIYNKKYPIMMEYIGQFDNLPRIIGQATASELQQLSNVTHETLRQLRAMEVPVEHWDMILIYHLQSKLDPVTKKEWEKERSAEMPKIVDMLKFLDRQADMAAIEKRGKVPHFKFTINNDLNAKDRQSRVDKSGTSASNRTPTPSSGARAKSYPCDACGDDHPIYYCPEFLALSLNARKEFVRKRNLCPNCLKKGHKVDNCFSVKCQKPDCASNPAHNSTLCPGKTNQKQVLAVRLESSGKRKSE